MRKHKRRTRSPRRYREGSTVVGKKRNRSVIASSTITIVVPKYADKHPHIFTLHSALDDPFRRDFEGFLQHSGYTLHDVPETPQEGFSTQTVTPTVRWRDANDFFADICGWVGTLPADEYSVQCMSNITPIGHKILRVSYQWVR